jgi:hypothetical protein
MNKKGSIIMEKKKMEKKRIIRLKEDYIRINKFMNEEDGG